MKKLIIPIILVVVVVFFVALCDSNQHDTTILYDMSFAKAMDCYTAYIETAMEDWGKAVQEYCHYEDPSAMDQILDFPPITSYQIIRFERLSDNLWEIETFTTAPYKPYGSYGVNYVGLIDGEYRVMTNVQNIPSELTEGISIEPFEPYGPDVIDPDDVQQ